jgi:bacterioferritin-associated ferredoxin
MVVCHCRGVTDRQVRAAIDDGARTLAQVGMRCGAAQQCGGCRFAVSDLLVSTGTAPDMQCSSREDEALTVTAAA